MNKINRDETIALQWLKKQGLGKVKRFWPDPPDFVIGEDEIAVEVMRLSEGLETAQESLRRTIEEVLKDFGRKPSEPRCFVNCEYPFLEKDIPERRVVKKQLRELLQYLVDLDSSKEKPSPPSMASLTPPDGFGPRWTLDCGIILEILGTGERRGLSKWVLNDISTGMGSRVVAGYLKHIPLCMDKKKPDKPDKHRDREANWWRRWGDWWLLLVDHACGVPGVLAESEVAAVWGKVKESMGPFSKVIVISCYEGQGGGLGCITFEKESCHIK